MEKLNFDSGIKEYELGAGVLRFNPSDPNVYARFMSAIPEIEAIENEMVEAGNSLTDAESRLQLMQKADAKIKAQLDGIFPGNNFNQMLEGVSLMAVADIKDGILSAFKWIVNKLITGINTVVAIPFNGINKALRKLRDMEILGLTPFSGIKTISVPAIPYLAQGAVLPPNKPFMAMVGDQRHGTNIEAPLDTIKQAVAEVMDSFGGGMMAGFEATVSILREILSAILGIEIGDEVIAQAVKSYQAKMAVVNGGIT